MRWRCLRQGSDYVIWRHHTAFYTANGLFLCQQAAYQGDLGTSFKLGVSYRLQIDSSVQRSAEKSRSLAATSDHYTIHSALLFSSGGWTTFWNSSTAAPPTIGIADNPAFVKEWATSPLDRLETSSCFLLMISLLCSNAPSRRGFGVELQAERKTRRPDWACYMLTLSGRAFTRTNRPASISIAIR